MGCFSIFMLVFRGASDFPLINATHPSSEFEIGTPETVSRFFQKASSEKNKDWMVLEGLLTTIVP